jgi:fructokinase
MLKYAPYKVLDMNLRSPHYTKDLLLELMQHADFIKFNDEELYEAAEYLGSHFHSMEQNISFIAKATRTTTICVTKGAFGAVLYKGGKFFHNSGYKVKVIDTVGAGDSFLASLLYKLFSDVETQKALDFACAVGALVAGSEGANPNLPLKTIVEFMDPIKSQS